MVVGEAQRPRSEFLYELDYWEITAIIRGFRRRQESDLERTRWQTFHLLASMVDMKSAGLRYPSDLLPLPHDPKNIAEGDMPNEDEINEMVADMNRINAEHEKKLKEQQQESEERLQE
jgi:hypothetical protein